MASSSSYLLSSLLLLFSFFTFTQANNVLVGGKPGSWKIPSSEADSLNKWAKGARFKIDDSLVLHFNPEKDSVLQVNKKDYKTCNTSNPIVKYQNETTMIVLDRSGPFYFISGAKGHCEQGQKMIVVVLSEVHTLKGSPSPSPAPSHTLKGSPSPSPVPSQSGSPSSSPMFFDGPGVAPSLTSGVYGLRSGGINGALIVVLGSLLVRMVLL